MLSLTLSDCRNMNKVFHKAIVQMAAMNAEERPSADRCSKRICSIIFD